MSSQLQVTGEAKIRDIQGPVVANDGVITALDGAASQYVRGDGTLADFPTSSGGGSSVSYYLNSSVSQGTIGGVAYRELSKDPIIGGGTDIAISANGYVASYITDANDPDVVIVPGGNFNCEFYFSVSNETGNPTTYAELYKYDGTTFTLLGTSSGVPESINQGTTIAPYYFAIPVATAALALTDRLAIRIYVNVDGRTVTLHTENGHLCQVVTTLSKGMVSLNNLTDQSQFITTGTSGTNFNIVSSGDTHTFNLPVASATNTGKLSSTDWSTFNEKQAALSFTAPLVNTTNTISIPVATSTVDGYLDNADWVTFNSKQNAITLTTTGTSGASTLVGSTLNIPNYTPDLSGYLPLTGGTLTGALNGTTASFSGAITAQRGNFNQGASSGYAISMKNRNANQEWGLIVDTDAVDDKNLGLYSSEAAMYILRIAASTGAATFFSSITSNTSLTVNRFSNGDYLALKIENRPITAGNNGVGYIGFYSNSGDATSDTYSTGKIYGKFDTNSYNSARLTLSTVTGNNIYQDVLTAKDTNVGIGTINPAQTLHLFTTSTTANGVGTAIQIQSAGTGANQAWVGVNKGTGNGLTFSVQNNSIIFNTGASTPFGGTERLRINDSESIFTQPLSVISNDNNFAFNVQLRNNNTGTQALTGLGISDSSNTRKGQVLWIPSNYVTASLRNSFLVSSVTNIPLILCADATGADTPNIKFQSGATDRMVLVGSTGNFGIGLSAPSERLEVSSANARIKITSSTNTNNAGLFLSAKDSSGTVQSGGVYYIPTGTPYITLSGDNNNSHLNVTVTGNVGIGTTTPATKLDVVGAATFSSSVTAGDAITISMGAGNYPRFISTVGAKSWESGYRSGTTSFEIREDGTTRLAIANGGAATFSNGVIAYGLVATDGTYQTQIGVMGGTDGYLQALKSSDASATNLRFYTGINERMRITSGGAVGINTSSPSSTSVLTLQESSSLSGALSMLNRNGNQRWLLAVDAAAVDDKQFAIIDASANAVRMSITSTGNVGIGTSSPEQKLHVEGTIQLGNQENLAWAYDNGFYYNYITNIYDNSNGIIYRSGAWTGTTDMICHSFETWNGSWQKKLVINKNGNVGIGTTSPSYRLDVLGSGGTNQPAQFASSTTNLYTAYRANGIDVGYIGNGVGVATGGSATDFGFNSSYNMVFTTTGAAERMRITSGGALLIGTTSLLAGSSPPLVTNGASAGPSFVNADSGQQSLLLWNKGTSGNNLFIEFHTESSLTIRGSIDYNRAAGLVRYNVTSDYRLKTDFQDFNGYDLLNNIKVYDYQLKETGSRVYGVVAHELSEVLPYVVSGEKDGVKMQGVDYSLIVPILVKSIQELEARIKQLENK